MHVFVTEAVFEDLKILWRLMRAKEANKDQFEINKCHIIKGFCLKI